MAVNPRLQAALLPGGRLHLQDGPIDLIIHAHGEPGAVTEGYRAAAARMATILDELCSELPLLRTPGGRRAEGVAAQMMQDAVQPFQGACFITPMAAVAGAVAQIVLAALGDIPLHRVTVNNGGDIALHLAPGQRVIIGLAARPEQLRLYGQMQVTADQPSRGVATSGFGGRSDTFGIADAVTVLARTAAMADAAATIVANAVDLPGHPAIRRGPSQRAQSDLGERAVTQAVGPLAPDEIASALAAGAAMARSLAARGLLDAAALHLRGATLLVQDGAQFTLSADTDSKGTDACPKK